MIKKINYMVNNNKTIIEVEFEKLIKSTFSGSKNDLYFQYEFLNSNRDMNIESYADFLAEKEIETPIFKLKFLLSEKFPLLWFNTGSFSQFLFWLCLSFVLWGTAVWLFVSTLF